MLDLTIHFRRVLLPFIRFVAGACTLVLGATGASAQLPSASAASFGLGDNFTAVARGFGAVAWNSANLGLSANPDFSLTFLNGRGTGQMGPVALSDLSLYQGQILPNDVRDEWMRRVEEGKGQSGNVGAGITFLALSVGNIGLQVATSAVGDADLAPGAVELALYGNAGRTGSARELSLAGSRMTTAVTSTLAFALAHPIRLGAGTLSFGATAKYVIGNAFVHGEDRGSTFGAQPTNVDLRFPVVVSDTSAGAANRGRGVGLDLGVAWESGPVTAGVAVLNVVNSFKWDAESFFYYPLEAFFGADTSFNATAAQPLASAPADVQAWVSDQRFQPALSAGASFRATSRLRLSVDVRRQFGDGLAMGERSHAGVGAELRVLPFVPVRAGVSVVSGGYLLAAGTGLELGPVNLTASAQRRSTARGESLGVAAGLSFGAR